MKSYEVYVQEKFYKTMVASSMQELLMQVNQDISQNLVPDFDATRPQSIKILPSVENNS